MEREHRTRSVIWKYFTKKDRCIATCNTCNHDYSYRSSVSNLTKHYVHKHGKPSDFTDHSNSDTSDEEQENSISKRKSNPTWTYFETLDSDKFEANCKLCGKNVPYETVSDLTNHVREHGEKPKDSDDEDEGSEVQGKKTRKISKMWKYFKDIDSEAKMASCLICKKILSYISTITNLRRHLVRRHPEVMLDNEEDAKKVIISANGQLYEIETGPHKVEVEDDEKDPIEMDTVYLEDLEDSMDQMPTPQLRSNAPDKKPKLSLKRNFSKISKEQFNNTRNTSSEEEVPKKRFVPDTMAMHSIDYFGQYVVSLLKELPGLVSSQLQSDIMKQIFASKLALESSAKYTIVNDNDHNQSNDVITEPVTFKIKQRQSSDVTETESNDAMVESTDNNETN